MPTKNSLRTELPTAKRANQYAYYFHYWLNLTEVSTKSNSQMIGRCSMHIPNKDVKYQYLGKRIFWQHHVLGKWNICTLEITISDSGEYVLAYGQLDSVWWDWFDKQLGQGWLAAAWQCYSAQSVPGVSSLAGCNSWGATRELQPGELSP